MIDTNDGFVISSRIIIPTKTMNQIIGRDHRFNQTWLEQLPQLLDQICTTFQITLISQAPQFSCHLVLFGESVDCGSVALKLAPPSRQMAQETLCATIKGNSPAYPDVIAADPLAGWILSRRVWPGTTMQELVTNGTIGDSHATEIAARLLQSSVQTIESDSSTNFPTIETWLESLFTYAASGNTDIPAEQINLAMTYGLGLLTSPPDLYVLHGDFHHGNILQDENGWKIIDPKGVIAGLAFEIAPWIYNPVGVTTEFHTHERMLVRLNIFSEVLGISCSELWRNALVGSVLSDCWTLEDGGDLSDCHFHTATAALMALADRFR